VLTFCLLPMWGHDAVAQRAEPIRVALAGVKTVPTLRSIDEPEGPSDVIMRIVAERPGWFEWVPDGAAKAPDLRLRIEKAREGEHWEWVVAMENWLERELRFAESRFATIDQFVREEMVKFYLSKRGSVMEEHGITVELTLLGEKKPKWVEGDSLKFEFKAPHDGYLTLINVVAGEDYLLFPSGGESGSVSANEPLALPRKGKYLVKAPFGSEYVKAVFTTAQVDTIGADRPPSERSRSSGGAVANTSAVANMVVGTTEFHFQTSE